MKTIIEVTFETGKMNEVRENEDGTGDIVTDDIESELHDRFKSVMKDMSEKPEWFEEVLLDDCNVSVEGFENLDDYGKVKIKISKARTIV